MGARSERAITKCYGSLSSLGTDLVWRIDVVNFPLVASFDLLVPVLVYLSMQDRCERDRLLTRVSGACAVVSQWTREVQHSAS